MNIVESIRVGRETVGYLQTKANSQFKHNSNNRKIFEERARAVQDLVDYATSCFTSNA
jgi:hypothetical protein